MFDKPIYKKLIKIIVAVIAVLVLICLILYFIGRPQKNIAWGITFSTIRATELGFEPQQLFTTIINDLRPQKIRLPIYWSEIEPQPGQFDFKVIDDLLTQTDNQNIQVIVGLGKKQPRWPECHQPNWYNNLQPEQQDKAVLTMIETAVTHLKSHPSITSWQIENEPFFQFGPDCPTIARALYKQELAAVKKLDNRPTISTDSGEKGFWIDASWSGADIFGSTMYREAYYEKRGKYVSYPLPWWTYNLKMGQVKLLPWITDVIGVELQAEPWLIISDPAHTTPEQQLEHMSAKIFENNIAYATKVGFSENYLWGAEWWYWLQKNHGNDSMIEAAKNLFINK